MSIASHNAVAVLALLACACGAGEPAAFVDAGAAPPGDARSLRARLPDPGGAFAPGQLRIEGEGMVAGRHLAELEACGNCHGDVFAQQQASAHAFASFNNPVYRDSVDRIRVERGQQTSRMCGACHDSALLVDGAMDSEVDGSDLRAHNGVSCRLCHGMARAVRGGNGSYVLETRELPLPVEGDPKSIERHKHAAAPPPAPELCGSCHESFLNEATGNAWHLEGQSELVSWAESAFAGQGAGRVDWGVEPTDCAGCHMKLEAAVLGDAAAKDGRIHSHRFAGGHTWLAAMTGDRTQQRHIEAELRGVVTVDVPFVRVGEVSAGPSESFATRAGDELGFDVVVRNVGVGHRFPGGVRDAQLTWIEAEVLDERGKAILRSGMGDPSEAEAEVDAHVLRALLADVDGNLLFERQTHDFAALIADHTIAPRDAVLVRFRGTIPHRASGPLAIRVRLLHQSRNPILASRSCIESKGARAQRFAAAQRRWGRPVLDPCTAQPITELARFERRAGEAPAQDALARRLYEHGLALTHSLQERLDEARPSLLAALDAVAEDEPSPLRAAIFAALAEVDSRTGRVDEALEWLARAEARVPRAAAIARIRGQALARVWRWREAAAAFAQATERAPGNGALWTELAVARGSAGDERGALEAAQRGLELRPRDPDLLRVQALSLEALGADPEESARALEAYLAHRSPDRATEVRFSCMAKSALCALEREPVHEHVLRPAR